MSKNLNRNLFNRKMFYQLFVFIFFGLGTISGFGQNCKSELSVEKDRHVRSATENGAEFSLVLKNTSSRTLSFDLSAINSNEPCNSKNRTTPGSNVNLDVQIQNNNGQLHATSRIAVEAGRSYSFKVKVMASKDTPFQTWGCIEVQAKSESCNEKISTILSVYVPDPSKG